jgi:hypothetical protein
MTGSASECLLVKTDARETEKTAAAGSRSAATGAATVWSSIEPPQFTLRLLHEFTAGWLHVGRRPGSIMVEIECVICSASRPPGPPLPPGPPTPRGARAAEAEVIKKVVRLARRTFIFRRQNRNWRRALRRAIADCCGCIKNRISKRSHRGTSRAARPASCSAIFIRENACAENHCATAGHSSARSLGMRNKQTFIAGDNPIQSEPAPGPPRKAVARD